jgi:hypothetical protein
LDLDILQEISAAHTQGTVDEVEKIPQMKLNDQEILSDSGEIVELIASYLPLVDRYVVLYL